MQLYNNNISKKQNNNYIGVCHILTICFFHLKKGRYLLKKIEGEALDFLSSGLD